MRNVRPIELESGLADALENAFANNQTMKTVYVDDGVAGFQSSAAKMVESHLEKPVNEIEVLTALLDLAARSSQDHLHGFDVEEMHLVVVRRIRKLARLCNDVVYAIINHGSNPDEIPPQTPDHLD